MPTMLPNQKKQLENYLKRIRSFHKNSSILFALAGVIVLLTLVFHSYPAYRQARMHRAEILQKETEISTETERLKKITADLQQKAAEYDAVVKEWKPILDQVLPTKNPTDDVAKFLEEFALTSNTRTHAMRIENIAFSEPRKEADYFALPFRMSVAADDYNFVRFLDQIARSGSLLKADFYNSKPVITMAIEDISVSLPEINDTDPALERLNAGTTDESAVPTVTFTVEMLAYFRPPEEVPASQ